MGSFDQHANGATSLVAITPSPATSGTSLTVNAGDGVKYPSPPFNCTVTNPNGSQEVIRVTMTNGTNGIGGDILTIVRAAEPVGGSSNPIPIAVGATITNTMTNKSFSDVQNFITYPPKVYPGFGVNYDRPQQYWAADAALFKLWGIQSVRPIISTSFYPFSPGNNIDGGISRACAKFFAQEGFYVTWGHSGTAGATTTSQNTSVVVAEATYLLSQGITLGDFEIGNESELFLPSYSGTITTVSQLNTYLRSIATAVKAIPGWTQSGMKVSYAMSQSSSALSDWITNGLGDIDILSYHPYGVINVANQTVGPGGFTGIASGVSAFGDRFYVSEFSLDPSPTNMLALDPNVAATAMASLMSTYILAPQGNYTGNFLSRFMVWNYYNYPGFQQLLADGNYLPMWDTFFQSGNHFTGITNSGQNPIGT